jgi:hypothetical protein
MKGPLWYNEDDWGNALFVAARDDRGPHIALAVGGGFLQLLMIRLLAFQILLLLIH